MSRPTQPVLSDAAALTDFGRTLADVLDLARSIKAWVEANREPISRFIGWAGESLARTKALEETGWLPHYTQPDDLFPPFADASTAHAALERHYRENWRTVEQQFRGRLAGYSWDAEAKACFGEALSAHGQGFYRTPPRLLFPELERLTRERLNGAGASPDKVTSRDLREKALELGMSNFTRSGVLSIRIYEKFAMHLYARVRSADELAAARRDPVPNRHAALHGLVTYASLQSSLNALIMAEFAMLTIEAVAEAGAPLVQPLLSATPPVGSPTSGDPSSSP